MARILFSLLVFTVPIPSSQALAPRIFFYHHPQNMFRAYFGPFSTLIITAFSVTAPQPSQGSIALSDPSAVSSQPLNLGNASSNDTTLGNGLVIACDGNLGSSLRVTSCKSLFPLLRKGDEQIVFADRTSSLQYEVALPFRLQGSRLHECQTRCEALSD